MTSVLRHFVFVLILSNVRLSFMHKSVCADFMQLGYG